MSKSSDIDVLTALTELEGLINSGVAKVDGMLKEAWSKEDLNQIREEISQARQELEAARDVLQHSQSESAQNLQLLGLAVSDAAEQTDLLKQARDESEHSYSRLKLEEEKGRECLGFLATAMQEGQQCTVQINKAIQQIETAESVLSELDDKSVFLLEIKHDLIEIINQVDGYNSIGDLVIAIREASERLQDEQMLARTMIEELGSIKRTVDMLVQTQRNPWWWPSNWWWKPRSSFSLQRIRHFK